MKAREFLVGAVLEREMVDRFLDNRASNWAAFDPVLGYRLRDSIVQDGQDGCFTISSYPDGAWCMVNYRDLDCRINTYGDSFTQCHQVSDGETWQEILAGHFGEPIRNFGVGGYGVYQAYRRMLREESSSAAIQHIILNIWSGDHFRSVMSWRWLHIQGFRQHVLQRAAAKEQISLFHANPWAHLHLNTETGIYEERENPCPTEDSLFRLCELEYVTEWVLEDDFTQVLLAQNGFEDVDKAVLTRIGGCLDVPVDDSDSDSLAKSAFALRRMYGLRSSMYVVDEARKFAEDADKSLIVLLSYDSNEVIRACRNEPRFDAPYLEYLQNSGVPYVDSLNAHVEDFGCYSGNTDDYAKRYYIGHYNPGGNHFFAFAIKDQLVDWLAPPPPTYQDQGPSLADMAATLA